MRHTRIEDTQALLIGALLIALGLLLLQAAHLFTGGIAGMALIAHYLTRAPTGVLFVAANLPFLAFAWSRMGRGFVLKTVAVNALLAAFTLLLPRVIHVEVAPWFASVAGGVLVGLGILSLARHRASVGGIGIVALWAQEKRGWSAGRVQMSADALIMVAGLAVLPHPHFLLSAASALVLSSILVLNHKPGRYTGF